MISLKLLFNRNGRVVNWLLFFGWGLHLWQVLKLPMQWDMRGFLTSCLYLLFVILGLSLVVVRFIPWYAKDSRGLGIEEHFEKTMVPVAYLLWISFLLNSLFASPWFFYALVDVFFLVVQIVNAILLYYHFIDTDQSPPSFFTSHRRTY